MDSQLLPLSPKQTTHKEGGSLTIQSLPPELSQAIWKLSLSNNRIITIHWAYKTNDDLHRRSVANEFYATYNKIEALEVSSESRTLALKDYKLCLGKDMRHPIYINGNKDILRFTSLTLTQITYASHFNGVWGILSVEAANIKRIAVEMRNDSNISEARRTLTEVKLLVSAIMLFATLETIFVQPSCVISPSSEAAFRAQFEKEMPRNFSLYRPSGGEKRYNVPEIVIVCPQCDPDFLKACQC
ncbi:hypothetical protein BELL_0140g00240 [Botrytis elliptica]|uniref:2EXR domain-containing protein n=1 Tax=Botrytis elliptica TaxID=278938 RepID=A0A4Z1K5U9_9HELO|nr:hypothetical protein BELL_0140g00240 [Botrytis elliptica]